MSHKIRGARSKLMIRDLVYRYVPPSIMDRPKTGFGIPLADWLREGPLHVWAADVLSASNLKGSGYFDPTVVGNIWREHLSGRRNWHARLWPILVFEAWLRASDNGGPHDEKLAALL